MALAGFGIRGFSSGNMGLVGIGQDGGKNDIEILRTEFGLALQDKRSESTIKAFQNPQQALEDYRLARSAIEKRAVDEFIKAKTAALENKLSMEAAIEYAKRRSLAYFKDDIEMLNLSHPYAESAEGMIALATGARRRDLLEKIKPNQDQA